MTIVQLSVCFLKSQMATKYKTITDSQFTQCTSDWKIHKIIVSCDYEFGTIYNVSAHNVLLSIAYYSSAS